jgi:hypothetical protein
MYRVFHNANAFNRLKHGVELSSPCRTKVLTNDLQSEQLPVLVCYAMVWISAKCHVQRENLG